MAADFYDKLYQVGRETEWFPWQKKFSWKPVKVKGRWKWLQFYFIRYGRKINLRGSNSVGPFGPSIQVGDIFDVLKS